MQATFGSREALLHEDHLMLNEDGVLIMIIAAVPADLVNPILKGFAPFYIANTLRWCSSPTYKSHGWSNSSAETLCWGRRYLSHSWMSAVYESGLACCYWKWTALLSSRAFGSPHYVSAH
jgi:hypothetical protein